MLSPLRLARRTMIALALLIPAQAAFSADYPAPREADFTASGLTLHDGSVLQQARLHYTTIGAPTGEPVLLLHGTGGAGANFLNADFAGELFGPGQPLDAQKYFIILPDALGAGKSSKPSDGLAGKFPLYNYDDMVDAQYRVVTEALGIRHLRLVIGNSIGGMQTWLWGVKYPDFMDVLAPMASQPTPMAGRNWMMRRMLTEAIRRDAGWNNGDYKTQPKSAAYANAMFGVATTGGAQGWYDQAPDRERADKLVKARLDAAFTVDANDFLYQWDSSRDYDAAKNLGKIRARLLAINAADDERNPPELGIMEREIARIPGAALYLIPASAQTRGHSTTGMAKFWKAQLARLLADAPPLTR